MDNPEQVFYVKLDSNGAILGQLTQDGYNKLSNNDKQNYQQVLVDQDHLAGWGKYWYTAFYKNGTLHFNSAWPKDQSDQINQLSTKINKLESANLTTTKNNQMLSKELNSAKANSTKLTKIVMNLQLLLAKAQEAKGGNK